MMMMEGGMIDTNRYDGVKFPISMCVRELELRSKRLSKVVHNQIKTEK